MNDPMPWQDDPEAAVATLREIVVARRRAAIVDAIERANSPGIDAVWMAHQAQIAALDDIAADEERLADDARRQDPNYSPLAII